MGKNVSISLGSHFEDFINSSVASGKYSSASEVVRSALRLLESEEKKLNELIKKNSFDDQLRLLYQPLVVKNLNDYRIFGSEVLVRWNNPELGEVRPETFIPVAEKTNLISKIGEWIF